MPKLLHKRRTKINDATMASAYSKEEIARYFKNDPEWRLASKIYWYRRNSGINNTSVYTRRYGVTVEQYYSLLEKYEAFFNHKYQVLY